MQGAVHVVGSNNKNNQLIQKNVEYDDVIWVHLHRIITLTRDNSTALWLPHWIQTKIHSGGLKIVRPDSAFLLDTKDSSLSI